MYSKFVCTQIVYVLKLCAYSQFVCTESVYILKECMYSKCVCTHQSVFILKVCIYFKHLAAILIQVYMPFYVLRTPSLNFPSAHSKMKQSCYYYFTSDIYFIYSPFWNSVSSSVIDRAGYQRLHTVSSTIPMNYAVVILQQGFAGNGIPVSRDLASPWHCSLFLVSGNSLQDDTRYVLVW